MITALSFTVWSVIKIAVLILLGIYIIFSLVLIKQVQMMTSTLEIGFETQIRLLAITHFLFAVGVFVFSVIIL